MDINSIMLTSSEKKWLKRSIKIYGESCKKHVLKIILKSRETPKCILDKEHNDKIRIKARMHAESIRLKKYNITDDEYLNLLIESNGKCLICHNERALVIDHNHSTGKVRGMICGKCNSILGFCEDNTDVLNSAINYLKLR